MRVLLWWGDGNTKRNFKKVKLGMHQGGARIARNEEESSMGGDNNNNDPIR